MMISVKISDYASEVIANFDCDDTVTGIKIDKQKDTFESAIIKTVEAINQLLENEEK